MLMTLNRDARMTEQWPDSDKLRSKLRRAL
jgi:hypothetical protein